ncbi:CPBP family intramembrane metalloprotease domain-containing protein [Fischerella thermalis CCMEE 5282]|uniref:CPBP family intramembrane glutamic endopeptidase n=1 Tax=Fischerella thermalis TaxID=372787 RepID=UPI000C7FE7FA|nr:type II CAAX endopeptidase family protein [Fischerella thermalis]PMB16307.1 CPBP family intramembrane metalloprotease domain-containing protein [Fischerella thermalis CCMEE 5282]
MTPKRLGLFLLTLLAIFVAGSSLLNSWKEPQFQIRLELYQTNIVLEASQWQISDGKDNDFQAAKEAIIGEKPLETATKQYQEARKSVEINLEKARKLLANLSSEPVTTPTTPKPQPEIPPATNTSRSIQQKQLQKTIEQLQKSIAEIDLRLGMLQAQQKQTDTALKTWQQLQQNSQIKPELRETATALSGMWSSPPRLLPNAQQLIQDNLDGWFRYTALTQLYQLQQRQEALANLKTAQQEAAEQAFVKLAIIGTIPALGAFVGVGLLIFLIGQRVVKGKASLLGQNADTGWSVPWDGETILQVFVVGFFFMGQVLIPIILSLLPIPRPAQNLRLQAFYVFLSYILVASGAISVLYLSIKRFLPLDSDWFRFNLRGKWFLWGFGGYCAALPVVVVVSLINQQIWQGQGGSNPLLQLALESQDSLALGIFFLTAAIAAPLFEEFLFRGFLLPSLTRYMSVWWAIIASSFLFAIAHLSLSEVLPLFALGIVLGVVYTRSRNLLAPMLLHSLWNSGTLLSLFILGSGSN